MIDVLEEPRTIVLSGRAERFASYAKLEELSARVIGTMQKLEAAMAPQERGAGMGWTNLRTLTQMLAEITEAQGKWLADCDAALEIEIKLLRSEIRNLQVPSILREEG